MAPKRNRAKPQRVSFLTRGREQLRQRQQTRQQASRQLPAKGESTAGSVKARGQRLKSAVEQRARMDVTRTRALGQMLQRNADRNARSEGIRQESRMTSGKTRYVPPGGENAKGQASLPPGQRGGDMRQKGGPLAKRDSSSVTRTNNGGPVRQVEVRDMGNRTQRQLPGQRALPGGTGGADRVTASGTRTGRPGAERRALPAAQQGGTTAGRSGSRIRTGGVAGAVALAAGEAAIRPAARALGKGLANVLRPVGRAIDDRLPGTNSKDEAQRNARKQPLPRPTPDQTRRAVRLNQASPSDVGRRPSQATTPERPRIAGTTQSRGTTTQSMGRTSSTQATTQSPTERRVSAATANRESGNYGTSRSDNKLLGDFIREKMRERENKTDATTAPNNVGPTLTEEQYAERLKIAKKDKKDKKS